jgi:hypothetical protein
VVRFKRATQYSPAATWGMVVPASLHRGYWVARLKRATTIESLQPDADQRWRVTDQLIRTDIGAALCFFGLVFFSTFTQVE